jgi:hypothetical protein
MLKIKTFRKKITKSGQINIAETVVSATIILVLSVSVAQLGSKIALSQETNSIEKLKEKAKNALDLGLSLGYVRELAYSTNPDILLAKEQLNSLISENLPISAQYAVFQKTLNNQVDPYNNRILLGITPIPSGNFEIFTVSVMVSGYYDTTQVYTPTYIVTLIVALGEM